MHVGQALGREGERAGGGARQPQGARIQVPTFQVYFDQSVEVRYPIFGRTEEGERGRGGGGGLEGRRMWGEKGREIEGASVDL